MSKRWGEALKGHIRKRGQSWELIVPIGKYPNGRTRYGSRTHKGTRREAQSVLATWIHEVETGLTVESTRLTFGAYCDKWLAFKASQVNQGRIKKRTYDNYAEKLRLHVLPTLQLVPLSKVLPLHIEEVLSRGYEQGLSSRSVQHVYRIVFQCLRQAVRWQLLPRNAAEAVDAPRAVTRKPILPKPHEVGRFLTLFEGRAWKMRWLSPSEQVCVWARCSV